MDIKHIYNSGNCLMYINDIEFSGGKEQHPREVYLAALYDEEQYKCNNCFCSHFLLADFKDSKHFL